MIEAILVGGPWIEQPKERTELAQRFCDALVEVFGSEDAIVHALDAFERAEAKYAPHDVPSDSEEYAAHRRWVDASDLATREAFARYPSLGADVYFRLRVVRD